VNEWRAITRELRRYDSAVIAARDEHGYPVSVRVVPIPDEQTETLSVSLADGLGVEPGPAWILCHYHDEHLWSLRSFGARGWLELTPDGWRFRPTTFVPGMGGIAAMIRLFVGGRRRARRYLAARGLEPPEIRWDRLNALKRQVKAEHAARSLAR
jgi:hypothetical protein